MKQLEIGEISSLEIEDLKQFNPELNNPFSIVIAIEIGIKGEIGKDDFRFTLANPAGLKSLVEDELQQKKQVGCKVNDLNVLCINQYSYETLLETVNEQLKNVDTAGSWKYIAVQINQFMYWEYQREQQEELK